MPQSSSAPAPAPAPVEPASDGRSGAGVSPVPATVVAGLCAALALVALALVPFTEPAWHNGQWYFLVDFADTVVFGAVSSVLLARGRHPVAWIVAACAIGGGLAAIGFQWSMLVAVHPDAPALGLLQWMQNGAWVPGTLAVMLVLPWLVRSEALRRLDLVAVGAGVAVIAAVMVSRMTDPFPWPDGPTIAPFAVRSAWWSELLYDAFRWEIVAVCSLGYLAAADVARRWRSGDVERRRGLGWLAVAVALMTTAFVPLALPDAWQADMPVWFTPILHLTSQLFFPAALLVAVLGQRLAGLDVAVSRATVYGLLSGGLLAVYFSIVWLLGTVVPEGQVPGVVGAGVVAAAFHPARLALQRRVDRLVRGTATAPLEALSVVGAGLGAAGDEDELIEAVAESLRASLRLGGVAIDVDWPSGARRLAQSGLLGDEVVTVPLVVHREHVGDLSVSARRGERLDRATTESLTGLAPVVAATVQLVAKTRALEESRARIAGARDEERRQLRRELHDGFGPALAGIGLGLQAARNLLATDPDAVLRLLDTLATEVEQRVEDVRTLARGLLPPVLEELGLVPALVELAERHHQTAGVDVVVDAEPGLAVVDPDQRGALYGIAAEAVRNVVRHSGATSCAIHLRRVGGDIVLTVADDGVGIGPTTSPGVGLRSMQERAEAIGAELRIEPTAPGTVVDVRLPSRQPGLVGGGSA